MRQEEALIGAVQFIALPLTFLSATFLQPNLMPTWIRHVSDFNPVNWAVLAGRGATSTSPDWGVILRARRSWWRCWRSVSRSRRGRSRPTSDRSS